MPRILLFMVSICMALIATSSQAATVSDVQVVIEADNGIEVPLPALDTPNIDGCKFAAPLNFTITALEDQSFRELFRTGMSALTVVDAWYKKTNSDLLFPRRSFGKLRGAIEDLKAELAKPEYAGLSFATMVDYRLRGSYPEPMAALDTIITTLIEKADFQFPLLDTRSTTPVDARFDLLEIFVVTRTGPDSGGLGNLTWKELFFTPAEPHNPAMNSGFSQGVVQNLIVNMQGDILPNPSYEGCPKADASILANNLCCCNNSSHGPNVFRKCSGVQQLNCLMSGTYCSLAGTQFCTSGHPPHEN